jgi:hypothetical protein
MRDLDATTNQKQWVEIIRRRTVALIQRVENISEAISTEQSPEKIIALRREVFEGLIKLCEASPHHDIRAGLHETARTEMDFILEQNNAKQRS